MIVVHITGKCPVLNHFNNLLYDMFSALCWPNLVYFSTTTVVRNKCIGTTIGNNCLVFVLNLVLFTALERPKDGMEYR